MSSYAEAVATLIAEADYETYAALPGAPTLAVGGTTWYLVVCGGANSWFRLLPESRNGFSTAGGYDAGDLASVLADSGV